MIYNRADKDSPGECLMLLMGFDSKPPTVRHDGCGIFPSRLRQHIQNNMLKFEAWIDVMGACLPQKFRIGESSGFASLASALVAASGWRRPMHAFTELLLVAANLGQEREVLI